jgi:D-3-phosphoglycerate dehydrogenase / 2-oxoglutarate reductase
MKAWKILITDGLEDIGQSMMRAEADVDDRGGISPDELQRVIGEYDALIVRSRTKVTPAVFETAKKLKVVGRAGVGVDNIDLAIAKSRGVVVVNAPTAGSMAVAELAFSLLLATARRVSYADSGMKSGKWLKKELMGNELYGKTLGIIGLGRIGSIVAERAVAFGMSVIVGYDTTEEKKAALRGRGYEVVNLDTLYSRADYISIHTPLQPATRGMIDAAAIAKMKPGVRIINTARGGIIVESALLAALNSGHVASAGLDVFEQEPPGLTDLVAHPSVIATPHIAAQSVEAQTRAAVDIATEVLAALHGQPLRFRVA